MKVQIVYSTDTMQHLSNQHNRGFCMMLSSGSHECMAMRSIILDANA